MGHRVLLAATALTALAACTVTTYPTPRGGPTPVGPVAHRPAPHGASHGTGQVPAAGPAPAQAAHEAPHVAAAHHEIGAPPPASRTVQRASRPRRSCRPRASTSR
jgi:hypothetical protein